MKKIIFLLLFMPYINKCISQDIIAKEAKQKFEGCWTGVINNDTITLILLQTRSKAENINPIDTIVFLYGWHRIANPTKVIESSTDSISIKLEKSYTIIASFKRNRKLIQLSIHDLTRDRWLSGELALLNNNNAILTTWLKETWRNENKTYLDGQTFPKKIELKRISKLVTTKSK